MTQKECKHCGKIFNHARNTFCCGSCSAKYNNARRASRTDESKKKVSATMKKKYANGEIVVPHSLSLKRTSDPLFKPGPAPILHKLKICTHCGIEFTALREINAAGTIKFKTTCSDKCFLEVKRKNARGNKTIVYKERRYDSSWEVEMVKFFESNNITFTHPEPVTWYDTSGKSHRYFADFYIPHLNLYVDPKNPLVAAQQREKLEAVSRNINLIYGAPSELIARINTLNREMVGPR